MQWRLSEFVIKHLLLSTIDLRVTQWQHIIFVIKHLLLPDNEWHLSTVVNKSLLFSYNGDCHLSSTNVCLWGKSCLIC